VSRRRLTWLIHNALVTPFIPIRLVLVGLYQLGRLAESVLSWTPGWRMYNGWEGW
jgi:hypothetical protein